MTPTENKIPTTGQGERQKSVARAEDILQGQSDILSQQASSVEDKRNVVGYLLIFVREENCMRWFILFFAAFMSILIIGVMMFHSNVWPVSLILGIWVPIIRHFFPSQVNGVTRKLFEHIKQGRTKKE